MRGSWLKDAKGQDRREGRWNRQERDLPRYQQIQLMLMHQAAGLVAESGILVYATCSLEAEENEEVIHHFLAQHPDFRLEDCAPLLPPSARELVRDSFFPPPTGPVHRWFFRGPDAKREGITMPRPRFFWIGLTILVGNGPAHRPEQVPMRRTETRTQ
jgi:hypothetical protein